MENLVRALNEREDFGKKALYKDPLFSQKILERDAVTQSS